MIKFVLIRWSLTLMDGNEMRVSNLMCVVVVFFFFLNYFPFGHIAFGNGNYHSCGFRFESDTTDASINIATSVRAVEEEEEEE